VKITRKTIITLQDLYHRKEEDRYILGNPDTGEFMFITAAELRAVELLRKKLTIQQTQELLAAEKDTVDLDNLLHALHEHGFIHKADNKILAPKHEPLHEIPLQEVGWLGGKTARFTLLLLSLFGVATLVAFGTIPSFYALFYSEHLTVTLLTILFVSWALIALRQFFKHAAARYLGVQSRFGFSNIYHTFVPKTYHGKVTDEQAHYILGVSLLALTAMTSIAMMLTVYLPFPHDQFWTVVFIIGFIEIIAECLLFMDTDLAKYITLHLNVHKLNVHTARAVKEDLRLLFKGSHKETHPKVTRYSIFYLSSVLLGVLLLAAYILPALLYFVILAFQRFTPGHPLYGDAFLALAFFAMELLLYGFALLRHHPLQHNDAFVNGSMLAVTVGGYILAAIGVTWFMQTANPWLAAMLILGLGMLIALLFEHAVLYARPFSEHHGLFEKVFLPVVAACVPISILFTVPYTGTLYLYALALGTGMLIAIGLSHLEKHSRKTHIPSSV
jgi:hypothetical protein